MSVLGRRRKKLSDYGVGGMDALSANDRSKSIYT